MRSVISAVGCFARDALAPLRRFVNRRKTLAATDPPRSARGTPSFTTPIETYDPHNPFAPLGLHQVSNFASERFSSFDEVQDVLNAICDLLAKLNLPVDSCRIGSYRRYFQKLKQAADKERHLTEREQIEHFNSLVEVIELGAIASAVTAPADPSMWESHFKKLVAGTHPHTNSKENAAWNFQYEMYLAAVTQLSGYDVTLAEPDVVVKDVSRTIGIAAKRPHSLANLTNNLKKGARQIRTAGLDGLVALDVSLIVGQNRLLFAADLNGAMIMIKYLVDQFVKDHYAEIKRACQGKHVMGCLVTLNMPATVRLEGSYGQMTTAARWTIVDLTKDFFGSEWIREFAQKCERGLFAIRRPAVRRDTNAP